MQLPRKTEWDLSPLLESDNDLSIDKKRKEIEADVSSFVSKWKNSSDYLEKPEKLKEALDEYEKIMRRYGYGGTELFYFKLRSSQNQADNKAKAGLNKSREFSSKIKNDLSFFTLKIAKIPASRQKIFLSSNNLADYHHYLEMLFLGANYQLSEEEEKIISLKSKTARENWVSMTSSFLSKEERNVISEDGKEELKNFSEIQSLLSSRKKESRDSAALAFNDILRKNLDAAEAEINSIYADKKIDDNLRKMKRPDFSRHLSDDIESEVVDALIESVSSRFDISRRYYKLKAKLLGVGKLAYHEKGVPYGNESENCSYEEAASMVHNVFSNLDSEFGEIFKMFVEKSQIDVYPRKGKISGAFCSDYALSMPTYILLNHSDKLRDVLTLAHESGHGINSELIKKNQNALNSEVSLATAEVASTLMESFVLSELLRKADDEMKLCLLVRSLDDAITTILRQVACYKFEQEMHNEFRARGYLPKEEIGKIFARNMAAYMGDAIEQSEGSENWWVYWSHIREFFYVYSYASGLLISKAMHSSVRKNPSFILKVKEFLSAGLSDSPKNVFLKLGIDISKKEFWEKGLEEIDSMLKETEALAVRLKKI